MVNSYWHDAWVKEIDGLDFSKARVAGRATKLNPGRENGEWWYENGSKWTDDYITWRKNNPDWKIWTTPQGAKAIELELNPNIAGVPVKMKTSRTRPQSDLQLGFYKVGVEMMLGVEVNLGNYWMSRESGTGEMIDLSRYTKDTLEYFVDGFDKARKAGIFLPNLQSCSFCGLTEHCQFTKKDK